MILCVRKVPGMSPMDYSQFQKWIRKAGYLVGHSTKHHVILDSEGKVVARFAVAHKNGGKQYVKDHYISVIRRTLGI